MPPWNSTIRAPTSSTIVSSSLETTRFRLLSSGLQISRPLVLKGNPRSTRFEIASFSIVKVMAMFFPLTPTPIPQHCTNGQTLWGPNPVSGSGAPVSPRLMNLNTTNGSIRHFNSNSRTPIIWGSIPRHEGLRDSKESGAEPHNAGRPGTTRGSSSVGCGERG